MRLFISILLSLCTTFAFAQKLSYEDFERESRFNKRLLPKQGSTTKSEDQLTAEKAYVEKMLSEYSSRTEASDQLVQEGIDQLKEDPKEAMYSFNNAYLIDSSNAHVYWGYGKLYSQFKKYELAETYYKQGLDLDVKDSRLLTSLARNYQDKYQEEELREYLERSIELLNKSLKANDKQAETFGLLAMAHLKLGDCETAKDYLNDYLELAGEQKDQALVQGINSQCE